MGGLRRRLFHMAWGETCRTLVPVIRSCDSMNEETRLKVLGIKKGQCAYCCCTASTLDHFRPIICPKSGLPTGFGHDVWNIVPCCGTCNSSKGNSTWRAFMTRTSGQSPLGRRALTTKQCATRMRHLSMFARLGKPSKWDVDGCRNLLLRLKSSLEAALSDMDFWSLHASALSQSQETRPSKRKKAKPTPKRQRGTFTQEPDALSQQRKRARVSASSSLGQKTGVQVCRRVLRSWTKRRPFTRSAVLLCGATKSI